jgi:hypothetical protein
MSVARFLGDLAILQLSGKYPQVNIAIIVSFGGILHISRS